MDFTCKIFPELSQNKMSKCENAVVLAPDFLEMEPASSSIP